MDKGEIREGGKITRVGSWRIRLSQDKIREASHRKKNLISLTLESKYTHQ